MSYRQYPNRNNKHKVRKHHWVNGELTVETTLFASSDEAFEYGEKIHLGSGHTVKIYNELEELIGEFLEFLLDSSYA